MTPHIAWSSFGSAPGRFANSRHPWCSPRKSHRSCAGKSICRNGSLIGPHALLLALMPRPSGSNLGGKVCLLGRGKSSSLIGPHARLLAFILRPSGCNLGGNLCLLEGGNEKMWLTCCYAPSPGRDHAPR